MTDSTFDWQRPTALVAVAAPDADLRNDAVSNTRVFSLLIVIWVWLSAMCAVLIWFRHFDWLITSWTIGLFILLVGATTGSALAGEGTPPTRYVRIAVRVFAGWFAWGILFMGALIPVGSIRQIAASTSAPVEMVVQTVVVLGLGLFFEIVAAVLIYITVRRDPVDDIARPVHPLKPELPTRGGPYE